MLEINFVARDVRCSGPALLDLCEEGCLYIFGVFVDVCFIHD